MCYKIFLMNTKENLFSQFGLCLNNEGYAASLEIGKVYRVIQDDEAASHGYIRVPNQNSGGDSMSAAVFSSKSSKGQNIKVIISRIDTENEKIGLHLNHTVGQDPIRQIV